MDLAAEGILSALEAVRERVRQYVRKGKKGPVQVREHTRDVNRPLHPKEMIQTIARGRQELKQKAAKLYFKVKGETYELIPEKALLAKMRDVDRLDKVTRGEVTREWLRLARICPEAAKRISGLIVDQFKGDMEWAFGEYKGKSIHLNLNWVKQGNDKVLAELRDGEKVRYYLQGSAKVGWRAMLAHEFGHAVFDLLDRNQAEEIYNVYNKAGAREIRTNLSDYAAKVNHEEFFAEAFAHVYALGGKNYRDLVTRMVESTRRKRK